MIAVAFWVGWLGLKRDRPALLLTFVLPPLLFLAFAAMFAGATGRDLKLKVAMADLARTPITRRLATALEGSNALRVIPLQNGTEGDVAALVDKGTADVGLVIRADPAEPTAAAPLVVVAGAGRPLAATILLGQVQQAVAAKLPDVLLKRILADLRATNAIDDNDRAFLDRAFADQAKGQGAGFSFSRLATIDTAAGNAAGGNGNVLQYAAAVAAIFLLFGAVQAALGVIDDRESGIADRLRLIPHGLRKAMIGRFLFLLVQGAVQVALIYGTAFVAYRAAIDPRLLPRWLLAVLFTAAACAGLALAACALSRSRRQAELWTTFAVLLLSALGGSMVPRYLMPPWLQAVGWWTPNAWIMEALNVAVLPGTGAAALLAALAVLAGLAAAGCAVAAAFA